MTIPKTSAKPIAIIGMAGIFPKAKNICEYWDNIIKKVDCITDVPPSRWNIQDYYDPNPKAPDKTYSKRGGFLPEVDFNPMEFGLPPNILESTDTSQILSLIVARNALQDAGYASAKQSIRERTGVILGAWLGQKLTHPLTKRLEYPVWEKVLKSNGISNTTTKKIVEQIKLAYLDWNENTFPGFLSNVIAGRIANRLDLGGINCVVDAACASSLGALKMAISELREYRSDMMISGGVDTDNSLFAYMCLSKTPALSRQDRIRPFDDRADGMLLGEGIGMMVLKRLEDAQRDRDRIYAVIKGLGASSDGKYQSISAPSASGQAIALRRAYEDAGFSPKTVGLIEAHGTGTRAGDPAEFSGLKQVFGSNNPARQYIALGSVKSQIGHTKAAAGVASLIKTALALYHKILPPTINIDKPNHKLEIEQSPFYLNTETRPWFEGNHPRRAGVSSFGLGGCNYHTVLEEYQEELDRNDRVDSKPKTILLHAPNPQSLLDKCDRIQEQWSSEEGEYWFQKIAKDSLGVKIPLPAPRLGFVAESLTEARRLLAIAITNLNRLRDRVWEHPQGIYYRPTGLKVKGKVVVLFSGQGSQYLEMGKTLTIDFPELRQAYHQVDKILKEDNLSPISSIVFPTPAFDREQKDRQSNYLNQTENAQPAIGAIGVGLYKILQQKGFQPDFVAGHSFGELTALWASGVFNERDYFYLTKARGQAMSKASAPSQKDLGKMLSVQGNIESISQAISDFPNVAIANWNSPQQVVLAGNSQEILQVKQFLEQQNYRVTLLPVSAAFHTNLINHAQSKFAQALNQVEFNSPQIPVYSNTTTLPYPENPERVKQQLLAQIINPVKFQAEIEQIYQAGGSIFVEFGTRNILTNLVKDILADKPHVAVALNASSNKDSVRQFWEAIVKLRVTGLRLNKLSGERENYQKKSVPTPVPNKPGLIFKITGSNYGLEQRKNKFLVALQDNKSTPMANISDCSTEEISKNNLQRKSSPKLQSPKLSQDRSSNNNQTKMSNDSPEVTKSSESKIQEHPIASSQTDYLSSLERTLMKFQEHQAGVNQVQKQYLQNQEEYTKQFFQLLQENYSLNNQSFSIATENNKIADRNKYTVKLPNEENNIATINTIDSQFLPKKFNKNLMQEEVVNSNNITSEKPSLERRQNQLISQADSVSKDENIVEQNTPEQENLTDPINTNSALKIDLKLLTQSLLEIVSEKTGYPIEMLELEMDIEADLGIDSIKRVEILGAIQESFPDLPPVNPEELIELRTLKQIATYMSDRGSKELTTTNSVIPTESSTTNGKISTSVELTTENNISANNFSATVINNEYVEDLRQSFLAILSSKTGYAPEAIELDMDLEKDLGLDREQKQEIFDSIASIYPDIKNDGEFLKLKTPGELIEYFSLKKNFYLSN